MTHHHRFCLPLALLLLSFSRPSLLLHQQVPGSPPRALTDALTQDSCPALRDALRTATLALQDLSHLAKARGSKLDPTKLNRTISRSSKRWAFVLRAEVERMVKECDLSHPYLEEALKGEGEARRWRRTDDTGSAVTVLRRELLVLVSEGRGWAVPKAQLLKLLAKAVRLFVPRQKALGHVGPWLEVSEDEAIHEVPDTFLSVALAVSLIQHGWQTFNTSSPKLLTLTRALSPAILRYGGSAANYQTYVPGEEGGVPDQTQKREDTNRSKEESNVTYTEEVDMADMMEAEGMWEEFGAADFHNFTITREDWTRLQNFAKDVGMSLLFDINQFYRKPYHNPSVEDDGMGAWDPSNARLIMQDTVDGVDVLWQLGNEPNSYRHHTNFTISPHHSTKDFGALRRELDKHFQDAVVVGPDVTRPHRPGGGDLRAEEGVWTPSLDYLEGFLRDLTINLTAVTWHQYYVNGRETNQEEFLSPEVLEQLVWQVDQVVRVRDAHAPTTPIWMTETGSAFGGGAPGLSDAFVGGFLWLDKLGVAARGGVAVVTRQTLYGGHYAMLDKALNPYPDYWLSVLFKRVVGGRVLNATLHNTTTTRMYAHCYNHEAQDHVPGSVVVFGLNLSNVTSVVHLKGTLATSPVLLYLLQAPGGDLGSGDVLLNNVPLAMPSPTTLPDLSPVPAPSGSLSLPPTSLAFWVFPHARYRACM